MACSSFSCGHEEPLIGRNCVYDEDCCKAYDEGHCDEAVYCDNSDHPGQCLKVCSATSECNGAVLGSDNVCVIFDFGGRCMRRCSDDGDCELEKVCTYPPIPESELYGKVCFPG